MNGDSQSVLLRLQALAITDRTPFCPDDQEIAGYFDDDLAQSGRLELERHLTDCRYCLARVGVLERLETTHGDRRIPGNVLAAAKQLQHVAPRRWAANAGGWAAAAAVAITLFTFAGRYEETGAGAAPPADPAAQTNLRQLRSVNRAMAGIEVLAPIPGAEVVPGSSIQWAEVPGKLHYDIFVLSDTGDVLWTERLKGTQWLLDGSANLPAGGRYYFRVEAQLADGRTLRSRHVAFRLAERD